VLMFSQAGGGLRTNPSALARVDERGLWQVRCLALPLRHRHGYAVDLRRRRRWRELGAGNNSYGLQAGVGRIG
jgi:hypothetical protein